MARIIGTRFVLEGEKEYRDAIKRIGSEQTALNRELRAGDAVMEAHGRTQGRLKDKQEQLTRQIELQRQRLAAARDMLEDANRKYPEGGREVDKYRGQVATAEQYLAQYERQLQQVNAELGEQRRTLAEVGKEWQESGEKLAGVGDKLSRRVTAPLVALGAAALKSSVDFESAFAGVRKTVDATEEEYTALRQSIIDMSRELPASANEIAGVMEMAGQLGIKNENLVDFTRTIIDLGEATNVTGQEGAAMLAQFANVTQMDEAAYRNFGSALVDLGNNSATTERDIMAMSARIAAAGSQAGLSEADILGLATAVASTGIEAEAGGSAVSKLIVQMKSASETGERAQRVLESTGMTLRELQELKDRDSTAWANLARSLGLTRTELNDMLESAVGLNAFADVTGRTGREFAQAFGADATGMLAEFVRGLQKIEDGGGSAIVTLEEMGISEIRLRDAILRLTGAGDTMTEQIERSNRAWGENVALTNEAAERYATTESQFQITVNNLQAAAIELGDQMKPHLSGILGGVTDLISGFLELDDGTQLMILRLAGIAAAIGPFYSTMGRIVSLTGSALTGIQSLAGALGSGGSLMAALGPGGVVGIIGAVGALAAALWAVSENSGGAWKEIDELGKKMAETTAEHAKQNDALEASAIYARQLMDELKQLNDAEVLSAESKARIVDIVRQLNEMYPDLRLELDQTTGKVKGLTEEWDRLLDKQMQAAVDEHFAQQLNELTGQYLEAMRLRMDEEKEYGEWREEFLSTNQRLTAEDFAFVSEMMRRNGDMTAEETQRFQDIISNTYATIGRDIQMYSQTYWNALEAEQQANENIKQSNRERVEMLEELRLGLGYTAEEAQAYAAASQQAWSDMAASQSASMYDINVAMQQHSENTAAHVEQQEQLHAEAAAAAERRAEREELALAALKADAENYGKQREDAYRQHLSNMGGLGAKGIAQAELTAEEARQNMLKQIEDMRSWGANMQALAARVPPAMLEELDKLGPSYGVLVSDLNNMTDAELSDWVATWQTKTETARTIADTNLSRIAPDAERRFRDYNAVTGNQLTIAEQIMRERTDRIRAILNSVDAASAGANIADGFARGIRNRSWAPVNAAEEMANAAIRRVRAIAQIKSPSQVMIEDGGQLPAGLAIGIERKIDLVRRAAGRMTEAAMVTGRVSVTGETVGAAGGMRDLGRKQADALPTPVPAIDYAAMAEALKTALDGTRVDMDGRQVGVLMSEVVQRGQRARGGA